MFDAKNLDETYLFCKLSRSIVGQQLSTHAAYSIWSKLLEKTKKHSSLMEMLHNLTEEKSRALGLSKQKHRYLKNLSTRYANNTLHLSKLDPLEDNEAIKKLTSLDGIGVWTAQMFLIFCLKRMNVFPINDAGIRRSIATLYNIDGKDTQTIQDISERWHPFKSVASWCLWNALNNNPVEKKPTTP